MSTETFEERCAYRGAWPGVFSRWVWLAGDKNFLGHRKPRHVTQPPHREGCPTSRKTERYLLLYSKRTIYSVLAETNMKI